MGSTKSQFRSFYLYNVNLVLILLALLLITNFIPNSAVEGTPMSHSHYKDIHDLQTYSQREEIDSSPTNLKGNEVERAPVHIGGPQHQLWGLQGAWKRVICIVKASPVAQFTWVHKGKCVVHSEDVKVSSPQDNYSILKVKVHELSLGEYTCRAENELGASEKKFSLGLAAKPPIPEFEFDVVPNTGIRIRVTGFHVRKSLHSIQISRVDPGEMLQVKGYVVQFRKFHSCDKWQSFSIYSEHKFVRGRFVPGTIYRIRLATKTEAGVGEFSRAQTVHYVFNEYIDLDSSPVQNEIDSTNNPINSNTPSTNENE